MFGEDRRMEEDVGEDKKTSSFTKISIRIYVLLLNLILKYNFGEDKIKNLKLDLKKNNKKIKTKKINIRWGLNPTSSSPIFLLLTLYDFIIL